MIYVVEVHIPALLWVKKYRMLVYDQFLYEEEYINGELYLKGIIGWTQKRKVLKSFLDEREHARDMYTVQKRDVDPNYFKERYGPLQLHILYVPTRKSTTHSGMNTVDDWYGIQESSYYWDTYEKDPNSFKVTCTNHDLRQFTTEGSPNVASALWDLVNINFLIFNDEFINALDILGYCDTCEEAYGDIVDLIGDNADAGETYHELIQYNYGFNLTGLGNTKYETFRDSLFATYTLLFYELIYGWNENQRIKLTMGHSAWEGV